MRQKDAEVGDTKLLAMAIAREIKIKGAWEVFQLKCQAIVLKKKKDLNSQHREKKKTAKVILTKENHILYTI